MSPVCSHPMPESYIFLSLKYFPNYHLLARPVPLQLLVDLSVKLPGQPSIVIVHADVHHEVQETRRGHFTKSKQTAVFTVYFFLQFRHLLIIAWKGISHSSATPLFWKTAIQSTINKQLAHVTVSNLGYKSFFLSFANSCWGFVKMIRYPVCASSKLCKFITPLQKALKAFKVEMIPFSVWVWVGRWLSQKQTLSLLLRILAKYLIGLLLLKSVKKGKIVLFSFPDTA